MLFTDLLFILLLIFSNGRCGKSNSSKIIISSKNKLCIAWKKTRANDRRALENPKGKGSRKDNGIQRTCQAMSTKGII